MKLTEDSVDKKYMGDNDSIYYIFAKAPRTQYKPDRYLGITDGGVIRVFHSNGVEKNMYIASCDLATLVSEYTPPRPAKEVVADLIEFIKYLGVNNTKLTGEIYTYKGLTLEDIIEEAEGLEL